jgi:hypothetical protein
MYRYWAGDPSISINRRMRSVVEAFGGNVVLSLSARPRSRGAHVAGTSRAEIGISNGRDWRADRLPPRALRRLWNQPACQLVWNGAERVGTSPNISACAVVTARSQELPYRYATSMRSPSHALAASSLDRMTTWWFQRSLPI